MKIEKSHLDRLIEIEGRALDEALFFIVAHQARNLKNNSSNYKSMLLRFNERLDNESLASLQCCFHIDENLLLEMIPLTHIRIDGKQVRVSGKVIDWVKKNSKHLNYIGKKDIKFNKSGKKFGHLSFWVLKNDAIGIVFNDSTVEDAKSSHYSHLAHKILDTHVLSENGVITRMGKINTLKYNYKKTLTQIANGELKMTQAEKEQYQAEYEQGLHTLTLKQYEDEEKRKQKIREKAKLTKLVNKMYGEIINELKATKQQNEELKAENEHLKSLVNENADIPREAPVIEPQVQEIIEVQEIQEPVVEKMENPNDGIPGEDPEDKKLYEKKAKHNENLVNQLKLAVENGLIKWTKGNEFARKLDLDVSFTFKSQRGYSYNKMTDVIEKKFNDMIDRQKCSHIEETSELDDTTTIDEDDEQ